MDPSTSTSGRTTRATSNRAGRRAGATSAETPVDDSTSGAQTAPVELSSRAAKGQRKRMIESRPSDGANDDQHNPPTAKRNRNSPKAARSSKQDRPHAAMPAERFEKRQDDHTHRETKDKSPAKDTERENRQRHSPHGRGEKRTRKGKNDAAASSKPEISVEVSPVASTSSLDTKSKERADRGADEQLLAQIAEMKAENAALRSQLELHATTVVNQGETISQMHSHCCCTICLELAWRPHVLSPCGHVFCARCLVSWFKRPQADERAIPNHYTPEQRADEERSRTIRREKVCPHCRERIFGQPAEVWSIKSLIETIDESVALGQGPDSLRERDSDETLTPEETLKARGADLPAGASLWKDIFDLSRPRYPIFDVEDGIFRCGACSSEIVDNQCSNPHCLFLYHSEDFEEDEYDGQSDDDDEVELFNLLRGEELADTEDDEWEEEDHDFIDDGPLELEDDSADDSEGGYRPVARRYVEDAEESDLSDIQEVDGHGQPVRRLGRRFVAPLSDSDDDSVVVAARHHSPRQEYFSEDEDGAQDGSSASETFDEEFDDEASDNSEDEESADEEDLDGADEDDGASVRSFGGFYDVDDEDENTYEGDVNFASDNEY